MTTWYQEGHSAVLVAYSVRPDLWPPGSHCWSRAAPDPGDAVLADWSVLVDECYPDEANGVPGAGEALILAGLVVFGGCHVPRARVEIPDPRQRDLPHPGPACHMAPGAAEALVLAGAVLGVHRPDPTRSWEEVT